MLILFAHSVDAQINDTLACKQKVVDFYNWYRKAIKREVNEVYQPRFKEDDRGYTTLDFSQYASNLKRFGFTDSFIEREFKRYQPCLDNLQKLEYKKLQAFDDISEYEDIQCDFFNSNRWIESMESFSGIEVTKCILVNGSCRVYARIVEFYGSNEKAYYGTVVVSLVKQDDQWQIDDIQI